MGVAAPAIMARRAAIEVAGPKTRVYSGRMILEVPARRRWGSSRSALLSLALHVSVALVVGGAQGIALVTICEPRVERPLDLVLVPARTPDVVAADEPLAALDLEEEAAPAGDVALAPTEPPALGTPEPNGAESDAPAAIAGFDALQPSFDPRAPRVRGAIGVGRGGVASRGAAAGAGDGAATDRPGIALGALDGAGSNPSPPHDPPPVVHREAPAYPKPAWRQGLEGVVTLVAVIRADGSIDSLEVSASSGSEELDLAALACVRDRWTFSPLADSSSARRRRVEIPIRFQLRSPKDA
jgi:periplasmic protein TonB